jgi:hypothetical protein
MKWIDQVPTIPGWYWEKHPDGSKRIIRLPYCRQWPTPWPERKAKALSEADDDEMRNKLEQLNWIVKWAGPIPEPIDD